MSRLYGVKPCAQSKFFRAFAVVPWPSLQGHHKHVVANEMGPGACPQHCRIGVIRSDVVQSVYRMNVSRRQGICHCRADIAQCGDGSGHGQTLAACGGTIHCSRKLNARVIRENRMRFRGWFWLLFARRRVGGGRFFLGHVEGPLPVQYRCNLRFESAEASAMPWSKSGISCQIETYLPHPACSSLSRCLKSRQCGRRSLDGRWLLP